MEYNNPQFNKSIMRRVYAVWFLKRVFSPLYVKFYLLVVLSWQLVSAVSVSNVFLNAPGRENLMKNFIFFAKAFAGTEPVVQLYVSLGVAVAAWAIIARSKRIQPTYPR